MSKMPPRTLNCATSSTIGTRSKPIALEMRGQVLGPPRVALAQLEPRRGERARQLRALEQRAAGRDEDAEIAAADPLERLDALAGDLGVRLGFAEAFARRVERDCVGLHERGQIGEPALGAGDVVADDDEEAVRKVRARVATTTASLDPWSPPTPRRDARGR